MNDRAEFIATLHSNVAHLGLPLDEGAMARMWEHFLLLVDVNQEINLTRITDAVEAAVRHYADSLAVAAWCRACASQARAVLDVGTGGGFPAVPLAICRSDWQLTAIDGTGKKIRCLEQFIDRLGLTNCRALHRRAEEWREDVPSFDLVLFRAIAPLADCLNLAERFCRPGSIVMCYKGDPLPDEEAQAALQCRAGSSFARRQYWTYTLKGPGGLISRQLCCYFVAPEETKPASGTASSALIEPSQ